MDTLPRWDLDPAFPGVDSPELLRAFAEFAALLERIEAQHETFLLLLGPGAGAAMLAPALDGAVELFREMQEREDTLQSYVEGAASTDAFDTAAARRVSELDALRARAEQAWSRFTGWLGTVAADLPAAIAASGRSREHAFILREAAAHAAFLLPGGEESLASDLALSGAVAWSKLQRTLSSQLQVPFERGGRPVSLPLAEVVNLRGDPDRGVRRRAWEAEIAVLKAWREPFAACLNGVKGAAVTLNRRRGRPDALHAALQSSRIDRDTLEALLTSMEAALPVFRRYLAAKARMLGETSLPWWDIFAPAPSGAAWTWDRARAVILDAFAGFSPRLAAMAERAFRERWIDAEMRAGKVGGGFCSPFPRIGQSRILVNFDGSLDLVTVVAHELGHAFHSDCEWRAGRRELPPGIPMTVAETASIMCESLVVDWLLERASDDAERLAVLEIQLANATQVIVDIWSRFLFEKDVMERREKAELSAEELCDAMGRAQAAAFGEALDPRYRHEYMWTWKSHYYQADLDFYNYPYAFGLLFSTRLYAAWRAKGAAFVPEYEALLADTADLPPAELAARVGIDLRTRASWDAAVAEIGRRVDAYCTLAGRTA